MGKVTQPTKGIFWLIEEELLTIPYDREKYSNAIAKSGDTYVHKYLWPEISHSKISYNYYPRGRVEINKCGKAIIYLNPNIEIYYIDQIINDFGLNTYPKIIYDNSTHYKCHLDDGWKAD